MLNEISAELVGKVNKARVIDGKPSKTPAGDITRSNAVKKAFLNSKVGVVKEDGASALPTNSVGAQGISAASTGPIQGISPLLGGSGKPKKVQDESRTMLSRIAPSASLDDKAGDKGRSLRDIVGKEKVKQDMKKEKKFVSPFGA